MAWAQTPRSRDGWLTGRFGPLDGAQTPRPREFAHFQVRIAGHLPSTPCSPRAHLCVLEIRRIDSNMIASRAFRSCSTLWFALAFGCGLAAMADAAPQQLRTAQPSPST